MGFGLGLVSRNRLEFGFGFGRNLKSGFPRSLKSKLNFWTINEDFEQCASDTDITAVKNAFLAHK